MTRQLLDNIERLPSPVLTQIMSGMRTAIGVETETLNHPNANSATRGYAAGNIRQWRGIWEKCRETILMRDKNYVDGQEVLDT